jgi:hypothetical protein
MASIFGNFILSTLEELEDKFKQASYEEAERSYEWAAERACESQSKYERHAHRYNHWIGRVEELERECAQLERWLLDPRATAQDSARYRLLYKELQRARHNAEEERKDARSAEREFNMREEVAQKRAARCGYPDSWFF